jgi:hypothetical protein
VNPTIESALISATVGVLVLVIGQVLVPLGREWFAMRRDAKYLAIRVVCVLEKYVEDCASTASDSGEADEVGCLSPRVKAPPAPVYPTDVNWKSIKHSLMYKILALPAAADRAASYVSSVEENSYPPDYSEWFEARTHQYSILGLDANALAVKLREQYRIPEPKNLAWDPVQHMRDELDVIGKRQTQQSIEWQKMMESAPPVPL